MPVEPAPWHFPDRGIAVRLFFTCWLVYSLHFATNIVREIYPAITLADHCSFRVDEYAGLHPDLFELPGFGWHINNNPGASMFAAVPYFLNKWWIDSAVGYVKERRGSGPPPVYDSPWPMAREFYAESWKRGLDIKLGLAALVMQVFFMAPLSAFGVALMFFALRKIFLSNSIAFWLAALYAFGTPVFFRTGTLNQNLILAHVSFAGFIAPWNVNEAGTLPKRFFLAGMAAGSAVLLDYSGVIILGALIIYGGMKHQENHGKHLLRYAAGALIPLSILWFYQWKSFGQPFLPAQSYMPVINQWVETGFHGYAGPQLDLLWSLLFDYRYGLFLACPILLLSIVALRIRKFHLPKLEVSFLLICSVLIWIFFSGSNYTRLQFNTGIRYLVAIVPFLFIPAAITLMCLPRKIILLVSVLSVTQAWCLAMFRDVERGLGILEPVVRVFTGGFQLPALTTLSRMEPFKYYFAGGISPLPLFALAAALIFILWKRN